MLIIKFLSTRIFHPMGSIDIHPPEMGHLYESKNLFRNFSRLSKKKPEVVLPKMTMSELMASESSDSGNDKTEFINNVECTSPAHHGWKQLFNIILPVGVETLSKAVFTESQFMDDFHETRKDYDLTRTEWKRNDDGELQRIIKYKMPLNTTMGFGPKYSCVTLVQTESSCCVPNRLYAADVVISNENIPYADAFDIKLHHCLTATIDDHSMYSVFGEVRYKRSVWGVAKSLIDKNCVTGMEEYHSQLQNSLQKKFCTPPSKGKRNSKRMSTKLARKDSTLLLVPPIVSKTKTQTVSSKVTETLAPTILIWVIFGILIAVVSLNTVLLFKLWNLEEELSVESLPDYESLRSTTRSTEEWIHLLGTQQNIHEAEVLKWQKILEMAIELIQNTEKTLVDLLRHIQLHENMDKHSEYKNHQTLQSIPYFV